jgi:hypothetical protein
LDNNSFQPITPVTGTDDSSITSNMLIIDNDELQYYVSPLVSVDGTIYSYGNVGLYSSLDTEIGTFHKGGTLSSDVTYVTYSFDVYLNILYGMYAVPITDLI